MLGRLSVQSRFLVAAIGLFSGIAGTSNAVLAAEEVNIYSYRQPQLIAPLLRAFTEKTGIKANVVYAKSGLIERMEAEGQNSPVDVLLTVDIGRLTDAKNRNLTQPVKTAAVDENIPATYRDPKGHWIGLSQRARIIYASKDRVTQSDITYEELAEPKWKGKICARSGQHPYNIALLASMIAHHGIKKAEKWAQGLKNNLARKPSGSDRGQVKGIFAGECDIAIGNSYYMAAMQTNTKKPEQQEWANSVRILFPNANDRGTHVNISGAVLAKHAPSKDNGLKLIDFLASEQGQKIYAEIVNEYPLKTGIPISERVNSWGTLKPDALALEKISGERRHASEIMDRVRFDQGPDA